MNAGGGRVLNIKYGPLFFLCQHCLLVSPPPPHPPPAPSPGDLPLFGKYEIKSHRGIQYRHCNKVTYAFIFLNTDIRLV